MARMFRVLGFFTLVMGLLSLAGHMTELALLLLFQTAFFGLLGYMNLSERSYLMIFWGYLIVAFLGFSAYTFFGMTTY